MFPARPRLVEHQLLERGIEARPLRYAMRVIQRKTRLRKVLRNDFMRDGAIVFASTMLANVLNFAIHFILSRKLGVSEYGVFVSLLSALTIVGIPVGFMTLVVVKFSAEFHALGERQRLGALGRRMLLVGSTLGALFVVVAMVFSGAITEYLRFSDRRAVDLAALTLVIAFSLPALRGILQGTQDFVGLALSTSIEAVLKIGLAVAFALAGWGVSGIFLGYIIAGACSFGYTLVAIRRYITSTTGLLALDLRRLVQTTGAVVAGFSAITLLGFMDVPLAKHFFTPSQAGIYGAVTICGKMLFFAGGFIPMILLPKAAGRAARGESATLVLRQSLGAACALGFLGLALFFAAPGLVVRVTYGAAFLPAAKYIFAYGVAMTLLALANLVVTYKIGLHRFDFILPLWVVVGLEASAIYLFHASLTGLVAVMIGIGTVALAVCSWRLPLKQAASMMPGGPPRVGVPTPIDAPNPPLIHSKTHS